MPAVATLPKPIRDDEAPGKTGCADFVTRFPHCTKGWSLPPRQSDVVAATVARDRLPEGDPLRAKYPRARTARSTLIVTQVSPVGFTQPDSHLPGTSRFVRPIKTWAGVPESWLICLVDPASSTTSPAEHALGW